MFKARLSETEAKSLGNCNVIPLQSMNNGKKPHVFYIIRSITYVIESATGFSQISDTTMSVFQGHVFAYVCVRVCVFSLRITSLVFGIV